MLVAGAAAGLWLDVGIIWIAAVGAALAVAAVILLSTLPQSRPYRVVLLLIVAVLGWANLRAREEFLPSAHLRNLFPEGREKSEESYLITGTVSSEPSFAEKSRFCEDGEEEEPEYRRKQRRISFDIGDVAIGNEGERLAVGGRLRVFVYASGSPDEEEREKVRRLLPGASVSFEAKINSPFAPTNPGQFDYRRYLERSGIYAVSNVTGMGGAGVEDPDGFSPAWYLAGLKAKFAEMFYANFNRENAAFLCALLLGDRRNLPDRMVDEFSASGVAHFLSISGLHIAIITSIAYLLLLVFRVPYRAQRVALILLVIGYAAMIGPRPPVIRASVMIVLFLMGQLLGRRGDTLNTLALAAIVMVVWNPHDVAGAGFQLSFVAVLAIILFTKRLVPALLWGPGWIASRLRGGSREVRFREHVRLREIEIEGAGIFRSARHRVWERLMLCISVSVAAWAGTFPLVAYYFGNFSPFLPVTNLLLFGLIYVSLAAGFLLMVFTAVYLPVAGAVPVFVPDWFASLPLSGWSESVARLFAGISWQTIPRFSLYAVLACYAALAALPFWKGKRVAKYAFAFFLCAAAVLVVWQFAAARPAGLTVAVLDVGHGGASVIRFSDGRVLLYDCGSYRSGDIGKFVVIPYLREAGIMRIDAVVVSHSHKDHFDGLVSILDRYPVGCVVLTRYFDAKRYPQWTPVAEKIKSAGVRVLIMEDGGRLDGFPEARFFLSDVDREALAGMDYYSQEFHTATNNTSLAMEVKSGGATFLFTGDMEAGALAHLLQARGKQAADVLIAPHHGEYTRGITERLLADFVPRAIVLISNKERGKFIEVCRKREMGVYETREGGAVTFTTRDGGITVRRFAVSGE